MAKNRRKSAAIALAVIGVAGLSLASATTLNIDSGTLQAGTTDLEGCQGTAAVSVEFSDPTASGTAFTVDEVDLSGIAAQCVTDAADIQVTIVDGSDNVLATTSLTTITATAMTGVALDAAVDVESAEGIAAVITD
jgi:hypothetical protein